MAYALARPPSVPSLERLLAIVAQNCAVPMAAVFGFQSGRISPLRSLGLSANAGIPETIFPEGILNEGNLFEIPDLFADPRFSKSALVQGAPIARFCAGAPIVNGAGRVVGAVCVFDCVARVLTEAQKEALKSCAFSAVMAMGDDESVFDLHAEIEEVLHPLRLIAAEKGLNFYCDVPASLPLWCRGSPSDLRKTLKILVGDAVRLTPDGFVSVSVKAIPSVDAKEYVVRASVGDSGYGPSDGIEIAKELVGRMRGGFSISSAGGRGSSVSFDVRIPFGSK